MVPTLSLKASKYCRGGRPLLPSGRFRCTSVEWKHDGTEKQGWYCGDKQDPGNPVFFDIDGYHYKGKRLSYASSCIHFDCEAGAGYNKDMKMWQCLNDLNQDSG